MPRNPNRQVVVLSRHAGEWSVWYVSEPGEPYAEAEAAALERMRGFVADEALELDTLEQLTRDMVALPMSQARARYPRAWREWEELEAEVTLAAAFVEFIDELEARVTAGSAAAQEMMDILTGPLFTPPDVGESKKEG